MKKTFEVNRLPASGIYSCASGLIKDAVYPTIEKLHQLAFWCLEPISKSPEEDNEASELYEAEEVLGVVFPTDEDATLP